MFYDKNNYGDIPLQEATHNNGTVAMESFLELGVSSSPGSYDKPYQNNGAATALWPKFRFKKWR